jgi:hypothetical protein
MPIRVFDANMFAQYMIHVLPAPQKGDDFKTKMAVATSKVRCGFDKKV